VIVWPKFKVIHEPRWLLTGSRAVKNDS